ncbi:MAG TPA: serpin family protein [Alphaproteobacteria bacterium]|nr:serpin family protein [Alphaproteobacteria bacterium]
MQTTIPVNTSRRRWLPLILLGILFEIALTVFLFVPSETWLGSEIRNLIFAVHLPVYLFLNLFLDTASDSAGVVLLLVAFLAMGLFWALVFYWILRLKMWLWTSALVSRHRRRANCVAGLVITLALIAAVWNLLPAKPRPFAISRDVQSVVEANNAFAIDLYQKLRDTGGNLFFSPYSISSALAMTYAGAEGQTKTEMAKVLHFDFRNADIPVAFQNLNGRVRQVQRWTRIKLITANSLWCQQNYPMALGYLKLIHNSYDGDTKSADFITAPDIARNGINSWVARKTGGKIQNLVGPGALSSSTRLVLCNAIYFKGKWQTQFKASETKPAPFYVSTNQTVTVPMMFQESEFKVIRSDDELVDLLELPYVGGDLSMIVILPVMDFDSGEFHPPLSDVEEKLTAQTLRFWLAQLDEGHKHKADVYIPRFTTVKDLDLSDQLKSLGMALAFDKNRANFSGMTGTNDLYLSDVCHKAFVEVNESGTEAAAASWALVKTRSMAEQFIANRPFIFLIRDNATGAILFLGRIVDPTK